MFPDFCFNARSIMQAKCFRVPDLKMWNSIYIKVGTHMRQGNIEAVWGYLCLGSVNHTPTRGDCLMRYTDGSIDCWYIKVKQQARLVYLGTHLRWSNIGPVRRCLCSGSVDHTPTRRNCLKHCVDWSISCWYIEARPQARLVSIGARCVVNMRSPY